MKEIGEAALCILKRLTALSSLSSLETLRAKPVGTGTPV